MRAPLASLPLEEGQTAGAGNGLSENPVPSLPASYVDVEMPLQAIGLVGKSEGKRVKQRPVG